jgi:hypothetical protein
MSKIYFVEIVTPAAPSTGKVLLYAKPDGFLYSLDDNGVETKLSNSPDTGITDLSGDVSASGPGFAVATVNSIGTSSAANVHSAELLANAATNLNTASTIVKRDSSGNFVAGTITANLTGNVSGSSGSFTGSLLGDVTGTQGATVVSGLTLKVDKAFTPTTPTDWPVVPTQVQQALDYLAETQKSQIDGGDPTSIYGGTFPINGGAP